MLNSGGANACTGPDGFADTHRSAEAAAAELNVGAGEVAVCSTGLIGERLPMDDTARGHRRAPHGRSATDGAPAAEAIRTTDTVSKQAATTREGWTVGGMAKGAGMLAPGLATMLCVLTTDALVDPFTADQLLRSATGRTFDRVDADGCMSTNDTVLLMASGASGVTPEPSEFANALHEVCAELAAQLLADAEGATKEVAHRGRRRGRRGRRCRGRPQHRPQQPAQVRAVRQRPELGTGARGDRHDRCACSIRTASTSR